MSLSEILEEATRLDAKSKKRALEYLTNTLGPLAATHYTSINEDLEAIKLNHLSSNTIVHILTLSYYWRHLLPCWQDFRLKCWHELVTARGQKELIEVLECLV